MTNRCSNKIKWQCLQKQLTSFLYCFHYNLSNISKVVNTMYFNSNLTACMFVVDSKKLCDCTGSCSQGRYIRWKLWYSSLYCRRYVLSRGKRCGRFSSVCLGRWISSGCDFWAWIIAELCIVELNGIWTNWERSANSCLNCEKYV